jgi:hypothetical protein
MSEDHLGGAYLECNDSNTFMPDVWQYLADKYKIKTMVDIGAGAAWNTEWWHSKGFHAVAIEGWPDAIAAIRMPMERVIVHDYTLGPLPIPRTDLGWSSEFVEHVEERFIPNWMATAKCCRYFCMTFAKPGQGGFHHVCERPFEFWLEQFAKNEFEHIPAETEYLRSTDQGGSWGRCTLSFFKNQAI